MTQYIMSVGPGEETSSAPADEKNEKAVEKPTEELTKRGESILEKVSASLGDNPEVAESVIDVEVTGIHEIRKGTEDNSLEDSSAHPQGTKDDTNK